MGILWLCAVTELIDPEGHLQILRFYFSFLIFSLLSCSSIECEKNLNFNLLLPSLHSLVYLPLAMNFFSLFLILYLEARHEQRKGMRNVWN